MPHALPGSLETSEPTPESLLLITGSLAQKCWMPDVMAWVWNVPLMSCVCELLEGDGIITGRYTLQRTVPRKRSWLMLFGEGPWLEVAMEVTVLSLLCLCFLTSSKWSAFRCMLPPLPKSQWPQTEPLATVSQNKSFLFQIVGISYFCPWNGIADWCSNGLTRLIPPVSASGRTLSSQRFWSCPKHTSSE